MLSLLRVSQCLILLFVGSVTLWYCVTPYLISPHPDIAQDVLTRLKLSSQSGQHVDPSSNLVTIENWTKWRLYVNSTKAKPQVIYGNSKMPVQLDQTTVMNLEWRSDYLIHVTESDEHSVALKVDFPAGAEYGIYNHIVAEEKQTAGEEAKVRVVPRFLFGLPFHLIEEMYSTDVSKFPIIGVFTNSPRYDRILIQAYMNVVTLSVIFLLYANNPPDKISAKYSKKN